MFIQFIRCHSTANSSKLFRATHNVGFVGRAKHLQSLKDDSKECIKAMGKGVFVCYNKNRVLVNNTKTMALSPLWLPYEATQHAFTKMKTRFDFEQNSVLLDITPDGTVRFGVQLHPFDKEKTTIFESMFRGKFEELRFLISLSCEDMPSLTRGRSLFTWHRKAQFCSNCGLKTQKNAAGTHRVCGGCRMIHYPSLWPVVMGLIFDKQKCLLVRQTMHIKNVYTTVAGFIEAGETPEEGLRREIAEEVGLEIDTVEYVRGQHWPFPMSSFMMGFLATTKSDQNLSLDTKEIEDAQWFDMKTVKTAMDLVKKNPAILLTAEKSQLLVPPPGPLAHYLIAEWVSRYS